MTSRSWRWLRVRILGLLSVPVTVGSLGQPLFATRIQEELFTPASDVAMRGEG